MPQISITFHDQTLLPAKKPKMPSFFFKFVITWVGTSTLDVVTIRVAGQLVILHNNNEHNKISNSRWPQQNNYEQK